MNLLIHSFLFLDTTFYSNDKAPWFLDAKTSNHSITNGQPHDIKLVIDLYNRYKQYILDQTKFAIGVLFLAMKLRMYALFIIATAISFLQVIQIFYCFHFPNTLHTCICSLTLLRTNCPTRRKKQQTSL